MNHDQIIKYHKDPIPHFTIDNFLSSDDLVAVFDEANRLYERTVVGTFIRDGQQTTDKEFKNRREVNIYGQSEILPQILTTKNLWTDEFRKALKDCGDFFMFQLNNTNIDTLLLSFYNEGDKYEKHHDMCLFTGILFLTKAEDIEGGDFNLTNECIGYVFGSEIKEKKIKFKNNFFLLFPSRFYHYATEVKKITTHNNAPITPCDNRICIQNFIGYNDEFR
jgi:Rps23 Pro-64 3,4-dihydroxylase Tpa1-like proline 4-hydroxylase